MWFVMVNHARQGTPGPIVAVGTEEAADSMLAQRTALEIQPCAGIKSLVGKGQFFWDPFETIRAQKVPKRRTRALGIEVRRLAA